MQPFAPQNRDIEKIQRILRANQKQSLANLLTHSISKVSQSGTFGSYLYSVLSTFEIYAPVEQMLKLKRLGKRDQKALLDAVLTLYPPRENSPEITGIEFLILDEETQPIDTEENDEKANPSELKSINIFISYSRHQGDLAEMLKNKLEDFGFSVFVAHDDIPPSTQWREEIIYALDKHDVFVPIITRDFLASAWCNQESGVAIQKKTLIFPIQVEQELPPGFLNAFQGIQFDRQDYGSLVDSLISSVEKTPSLAMSLKDCLVKAFVNSKNFDSTRRRLEKLKPLGRLTWNQALEALKGSVENDQIFKAHQYSNWIGRDIAELTSSHKEKLPEELKMDFNRRFFGVSL